MSTPAYVVRRGQGAPVLFLHGSGVDHRLLLVLDEIFQEESGWERIFIDLPGFGGTPALPGAGGLPDLADWIDTWVDEVVGRRRFAIVANSLGGFLARELLARRPNQVSGLALLAPVVDPCEERRRTPDRHVVHEDDLFMATLNAADATAFGSMAVTQTRASWELFRLAALPGIRAADRAAVHRLESEYYLDGRAPEERFGEFTGPTLIVAGRQDHVVGYEDQLRLAQSYPRSTVAVLDRAGHNVHLDQPAMVAALLREWQAQAAAVT